jgi:hypothetical protein
MKTASAILYWDYARTGYGDTRVQRFRREVDERGLHRASELFQNINGPAVKEIAGLKLPEFVGLSFISKVRMFLNPADYVVLDRGGHPIRCLGQPNPGL